MSTKSVGDGFLEELEHDPHTATREALADVAADLMDRIAALDEKLEADGLVVSGSKGQPVAHPGIEMVRRLQLALAKILSQLDTPGSSAAGKALARKRWDR